MCVFFFIFYSSVILYTYGFCQVGRQKKKLRKGGWVKETKRIREEEEKKIERTENKKDCGEEKTKTGSGKNWGGENRGWGETKKINWARETKLEERTKKNWRSEGWRKKKIIQGGKGNKKDCRGRRGGGNLAQQKLWFSNLIFSSIFSFQICFVFTSENRNGGCLFTLEGPLVEQRIVLNKTLFFLCPCMMNFLIKYIRGLVQLKDLSGLIDFFWLEVLLNHVYFSEIFAKQKDSRLN